MDRKFLFKPARRESLHKTKHVSVEEEVTTFDDEEEEDWSVDEDYCNYLCVAVPSSTSLSKNNFTINLPRECGNLWFLE